MISEVMGYTFAVSLLISVAGYGLDRAGVFREGGRRWIWAAAMLLSFAVPAAVLLRSPPPMTDFASPPPLSETAGQADTLNVPPSAPTVSVQEVKPVSAQGSVVEHPRWYAGATLNIALTILWVAGSSGLALWLVIGQFILARKALGWAQERVDGHDVRVSDDSGPAVVGFLRPVIVLPRWLSVEARGLALRHEAQHLVAGDSRLVLFGLVLLVLMPWNAPLWWQFRRLRLALELDCDTRVRRGDVNVDVYAHMLLAVCEHKSRIGVLAMSARRSDLERRLTALLVRSPQRRSVTAAAIAISVAVAASATQLPAPIIRPPVTPLAEEIPADAPAELKEGLAAFDRGDYQTALTRLRPLAEQGNAMAERHLGQMYDRGLGMPQDYGKAVAWYRKSAAQGDIDAQQGLADMYVQGHGVPHDRDAAALWQRRMLLQLFAYPCDPKYNFQFKGDIENKTAEYRKAAEHGDGQAASDLGSWYETGFYSGPKWRKWKPDHAAALKWLSMAAEHGNANGEAALASLYLRGSAPPPDAKAAVTWMRKAAEQGLPRAQCSLAVMYDKGIGTSQDRAEAAKWYRTVANTEPHVAIGQYAPDPYMLNFARTKLGILYETGDGVPSNDGEAITWLRRAVDHGYPPAETHLGLKYAEGRGVARDTAKALALLSSAAWKGDTSAQIGLARLYASGAPQDPVRAYIWLSIAARYPSSAAERAQALKERDAIALTRPQIEQANRVVEAWRPVDDLGGGGHAGGHSRRPTYP